MRKIRGTEHTGFGGQRSQELLLNCIRMGVQNLTKFETETMAPLQWAAKVLLTALSNQI